MKAIFLDIDGVLNDENILLEKQEENQIEISKEKLLLLKEIITKTNSKIILSSSWRNGLKNNKEIENYIILDDEPLNSKHQIKTDFENGGLTKKHVKTAINKLNRVRKR